LRTLFKDPGPNGPGSLPLTLKSSGDKNVY